MANHSVSWFLMIHQHPIATAWEVITLRTQSIHFRSEQAAFEARRKFTTLFLFPLGHQVAGKNGKQEPNKVGWPLISGKYYFPKHTMQLLVENIPWNLHTFNRSWTVITENTISRIFSTLNFGLYVIIGVQYIKTEHRILIRTLL